MRQLFCTIPLLLLFSGCASLTSDIRVKTELGINADLSQYQSYTWLDTVTTLNDPSGKWQPSGLDITREIKFFIDRELSDYGLYLSSTNPGLAVTFELGANMQALKLKTDPNSKLAVLKNVPDAALMVVLVDTTTNNIIWISKAEAELQQQDSKELVLKRIDYTITEMFKTLKKQSFF